MAKYIMQEAVDLNNEGKTLTYPKLIIDQCIDSEELAKQVSNHTTFSKGEVMAIIDHLWSYMAENMGEGRSVKINGLGVFTPTLAYRKGVEREAADGEGGHRNAQSLRVGGINFRPDKQMVNEVNSHMDLRKVAGKFRRRVSEYTEEERLERAKTYMREHGVMRLSDYTTLVDLSRTSAYRELNKWSHDATIGIKRAGGKGHAVYLLA